MLKRQLVRAFQQLLVERLTGARGRPAFNDGDTELFKLGQTPDKPTIGALNTTLKIYQEWLKNPKPLWKIGEELGLNPSSQSLYSVVPLKGHFHRFLHGSPEVVRALELAPHQEKWMLLLARIASALLLAGALHPFAIAHDESAVARVETLVPFASPEGLDRLARTTAKSDFAPLANQFEAQATIAFCGPTTAAIVLNALRPKGIEVPRDRSRLHPADALYC